MDPVTLIILTVLICLGLFIFLKGSERDRKIAKAISKLPGERKYPIIGSQWSVLKAGKRNFYYAQRARNKKYGPVFINWLGNIPFVSTFKPEHIQAVFKSRLNVNKPETYDFFRTVAHDGLFTSRGDTWRRDRKLITPTLHLQMLDSFVPIFNERGRMLSSKLLDLSRNGTFFDVFPLMQRFAFDAICETSTGFKTHSLEGENVHYANVLEELFETVIARIINPFLHNDFIFKLSSTGKKFYRLQREVEEFIQSIIDWRKKSLTDVANSNFDGLKEHNSGEKNKKIFLDALLEAGGSTEDRDDFWIRCQVLTLVFAGLDTTSVSLSWALYALATNPEIQRSLFDDLLPTSPLHSALAIVLNVSCHFQGDTWRRDRKLITPTLHLQMLDSFVPIFNERGRMLSSKLLDLSRNGTFFDVFPLMQRFAFDAICETSTGFKTHSLEGENVHYANVLEELFETVIARIINPFLHNDFIFKLSSTGKKFYRLQREVEEFIQSIIDWRKKSLTDVANSNFDGLKEHNSGEKNKKIFLDALLEAGGSTEDRDDFWIRCQVLTLVFAGLDTTSVSLSWALYALATNPEIQETVYEELKETFHDDMERDVTMQDINSMTYLDRTVKEVLRLYTVVPYLSRKLEEEVVLDELTIPAGCTVAVQIFELHRDPTIYPDPEKFDPDRFLPENVSKRHPYSYVPFSAGHRNCLGQKFSHKSLRIALVHVLRKYRVVAQHRPEELRYTFDLTFKSESGIFLKFEKRK